MLMTWLFVSLIYPCLVPFLLFDFPLSHRQLRTFSYKIKKFGKNAVFFLSRFILWCSASSEATVHHSVIDWLIDWLFGLLATMRSSFALPWLPQLDSCFFVVFWCVFGVFNKHCLFGVERAVVQKLDVLLQTEHSLLRTAEAVREVHLLDGRVGGKS